MTRQALQRLGIQEGDLALDIGGGGGETIARMAAAGAIVRGSNLSPTSVEVARAKNCAAIAVGRMRSEQASVDAAPFGENMLDWVTAFETVYFWANSQTNFSRILGMLKPEERFAVVLEACLKNGKKELPRAFQQPSPQPVQCRKPALPCGTGGIYGSLLIQGRKVQLTVFL